MILSIHCLVLLFFIHTSNSLQCVDDSNNTVDWFIVYKLPVLNNTDDMTENGETYYYVTSNQSKTWTKSEYGISDSKSIVGQILDPYYKDPETVSHVFYSDFPTNDMPHEDKGHTKGVILTDEVEGLWLITSVMQFPELNATYTYPSTGKDHADLFFCVSMDLENINKIGKFLQAAQANIYEQNIEKILDFVPDLQIAITEPVDLEAPYYSIDSLSSLAGTNLTVFSKSKDYSTDVYATLVAPSLETDLFVQTAVNGDEDDFGSDCSGSYSVFKVQNQRIDSNTFNSTIDHTKWVVSTDPDFSDWFCVGDLDRIPSQLKRGGGVVCLEDKQLANLFSVLISAFNKCHNFQ